MYYTVTRWWCNHGSRFLELQYTLSAYLNTWKPTTPPGTDHISGLNDACRSADHRGARLFKHARLIGVIRYLPPCPACLFAEIRYILKSWYPHVFDTICGIFKILHLMHWYLFERLANICTCSSLYIQNGLCLLEQQSVFIIFCYGLLLNYL